jgi:hypothetical protein
VQHKEVGNATRRTPIFWRMPPWMLVFDRRFSSAAMVKYEPWLMRVS